MQQCFYRAPNSKKRKNAEHIELNISNAIFHLIKQIGGTPNFEIITWAPKDDGVSLTKPLCSLHCKVCNQRLNAIINVSAIMPISELFSFRLIKLDSLLSATSRAYR